MIRLKKYFSIIKIGEELSVVGNYGYNKTLMSVTGNYGYDMTVMSVTGNYGFDFTAMKVTGNYGYDHTAMVVTGNYGYDYTVMFVSCFPKTELVRMSSDIHIPIGALKVGDKISTYNLEDLNDKYTAVTGIHEYVVNEILCFNNAMRVSSSHPLLVVEHEDSGFLTPKWKVSYDVNVGDYVVGHDGNLIKVKSRTEHWYELGIEVLNLSTDSGVPFLVGNCVVKAENANDNITLADAPLTQKLLGKKIA